MNHISLFSGIGGFDYAAQKAGWNNIAQVEKDPFCLKVLRKNFPDVKKYEEIKKFDGAPYRRAIDIISGGAPCQPFSQAGQRRGTEDDRHLWPEFIRIIREVQPVWVVFENVSGFVNWAKGMALEATITDLENEGYETIPVVLPACAVGAPHRRDRIWIVAYSKLRRPQRINKMQAWKKTGNGIFKAGGTNVANPTGNNERRAGVRQEYKTGEVRGRDCNVPNPIHKGFQRSQFMEAYPEREGAPRPTTQFCENVSTGSTTSGEYRNQVESGMGGMDDGIPSGMDGRLIWGIEPDIPRTVKSMKNRANRLKGLGNAIVPQVAYQIFETINDIMADQWG